MTTGMLMHCRS